MKTKTITKLGVASMAIAMCSTASAATYAWSGGSGNLDSTNYDLGITPFNTVADIVNITNGGQSTFSNRIELEGLDTYNVSNGGIIQTTKPANKTIIGNGATINIGSGGTVGAGNRFLSSTVNLTGDGVLLMGNGTETLLPQLGTTTVNLDSAWTGEVYFTAHSLLDDLSKFDSWLDDNGADKFFINGVALTSADRGTKFVVDIVTSGSGLEPTFATNDAGLSMTLPGPSSVPEPSSTALIGLGGLALILRRRR